MKEKLKILFWFLLPIILCLPQFVVADRYDTAKASGYEIEATIVDIEETEEYDPSTEDDTTAYIYYVDYVVDGKEYNHIEAKEKGYPGNLLFVGDTMKVVVNPQNPAEIINDGDFIIGFMSIAGFLLGIFNVITLFKAMKSHIKAKKEMKRTKDVF